MYIYMTYANIFIEKMREAFALQMLLSFFQQKILVYLVLSRKTLNELTS